MRVHSCNIAVQQTRLLFRKTNHSSPRTGDNISKLMNGLVTNRNSVIFPDGTQRQDGPCWRGPREIYWNGLENISASVVLLCCSYRHVLTQNSLTFSALLYVLEPQFNSITEKLALLTNFETHWTDNM
jgi:hypothetical protein